MPKVSDTRKSYMMTMHIGHGETDDGREFTMLAEANHLNPIVEFENKRVVFSWEELVEMAEEILKETKGE